LDHKSPLYKNAGKFAGEFQMKAERELDETGRILYTKMGLSFLLALFKLLAGLFGHSTLLLVDSIRSFSKFFNEGLKFLEIFIANKPDESHNYGHGKIITLFKGAGATLLILASIKAFSFSLGKVFLLTEGKGIEPPETITFLTAISAMLIETVFITFPESRKIKIKSISLKELKQNQDLLLSILVVLGIGCTLFPVRIFDAADLFGAFLISLYLLAHTSKLLCDAGNELIEASLDKETNQKIMEIINRTEGVLETGELKTRKIGKGIAINASISVNDSLNIQKAEEITNMIETSIKRAFGEDSYTLIKIEPGYLKNRIKRSD